MITESITHQLTTLTPKGATIPYPGQGQPDDVRNRAETESNRAEQFAPPHNAVSAGLPSPANALLKS